MKLGETEFGKYIRSIAKTIHPVRAVFEVCGTAVISIPFITAFVLNHSAPIYLFLLYPALFLVSHFVWFRLPSVDRRVRWLLFWFTLTLIAALGSGFLFWSYLEAVEAGADFTLSGIWLIPQWVNPTLDVPFPTAAVYFLIPSGVGSALYCLILALFLRLYRRYRETERQRRAR
jgi:hypothetical protein